MAANAPVRQSSKNPVGPLSAFGLTMTRQIPLLLPRRWIDLRDVREYFDFIPMEAGNTVVVLGRLAEPPNYRTSPPRLSVALRDPNDRWLRFQVYGEKETLESLNDHLNNRTSHIAVAGELRFYGTAIQLRSPLLIDDDWLGHVMPVYPGSRRCTPDVTRKWVMTHLGNAIPLTVRWIVETLAPLAGGAERLRTLANIPQGVALSRLLERAHLPLAPSQGAKAHAMLERLAALGQLLEAGASHDMNRSTPNWHRPADWRPRSTALGFKLTAEQRQAVNECVSDMQGRQAMRRILVGDVGTGKTAVYALVAAACVDGGGRVAVLLPNERLANQVFNNITGWWPDIPGKLLTGSTSGKVNTDQDHLIVGTTAVLYREAGLFDLIIIDEQHKFSREQRERLLQPHTHQLEVSATCIPRSQALMRLGMVGISRLRKAHVEKNIQTRIWEKKEHAALFDELRETCRQGHQVIVVYPRKSVDDDSSAKAAAEDAYVSWERLFPGRVALAHGSRNTDDNEAAMLRMAKGDADVLIATTVVEVGIDLPRVRRVMVVQPDRLGVIQLHQLRGRVARKGGDGWFDLYLQQKVSDKTYKRLELMTRTTDGFELAEMDMRLRGFGDLRARSSKQSGADDTFLFGHNISVESAEQVARQLSE